MDPTDFVSALYDLLRAGHCTPHLRLHEGKVLVTKVGGSWNLMCIKDLPGIVTPNLLTFKRCMIDVGFTMTNNTVSQKKRKRGTTTALLFAHPLFPGHIQTLRQFNELLDLVEIQGNMIDQRNSLISKMQAAVDSTAKRILQKDIMISKLRQTTHQRSEEVLNSIFDIAPYTSEAADAAEAAEAAEATDATDAADAADAALAAAAALAAGEGALAAGDLPAPGNFPELDYDMLNVL